MTTSDADFDAASRRVRAEVTVQGTVQGVGFRPFIYRTATAQNLVGWVRNTGNASVDVVLEGAPGDIETFFAELQEHPPPLASVDALDVDRADPEGEDSFEIRDSKSGAGGSGTIPPDTGICERCLGEVRAPNSRYHGYWGMSCVDCGPRFTVIRELPYDRPTTSMDAFPMCDACRAEYENPADRRYHAQTTACPDCGPTLSLTDVDGVPVDADNPVAAAGRRLRDSALMAIKGIGGTHLACDATDPAAIERLRERTDRPRKPFALMVPSIAAAEQFAVVDNRERATLEDVRRPIVLLDRNGDAPGTASGTGWLDTVAPGLHTVGVMLPYSGLHHLLFDHLDGPLVMTSANMTGRPMCLDRDAILEQLGDVVDGMLLHDREVVARCDDSVIRFVDEQRRFLRRSRGWVPQPVDAPLGDAPPVLALGAQFDTTVAVTQGDAVVPSQHVGDVDGPATTDFLRATVTHLTDLLNVEPAVVACDLHPGFVTTDVAREMIDEGLTGPVHVQHHHAHAAGLLAEHNRNRAVVVTADGTGYGDDGTIWGGEILDARLDHYERVGGLSTFRLPGGEAAIKRPGRILASLLTDRDDVVNQIVAAGGATNENEARTIVRQIRRDVNAPKTTSAGRLLDTTSALLGVCDHRRYEGEPAMALEAAAVNGNPLEIDPPTSTEDGRRVVNAQALVHTATDLATAHPTADVAATVQHALAKGLADIAIKEARHRDIDAVGLTGGVAYNNAIARHIKKRVTDADLTFLGHEAVPPGDGGIAYGQTVVAAAKHGDES